MEIKTFHSRYSNFRLITINLLIIVAMVILNNLFVKFEVRFLNTFIDTPKNISELGNPIDRILWFNNLEDHEFRQILSNMVVYKNDEFESYFKTVNFNRAYYNDNTIKYFLREIKRNSMLEVK